MVINNLMLLYRPEWTEFARRAGEHDEAYASRLAGTFSFSVTAAGQKTRKDNEDGPRAGGSPARGGAKRRREFRSKEYAQELKELRNALNKAEETVKALEIELMNLKHEVALERKEATTNLDKYNIVLESFRESQAMNRVLQGQLAKNQGSMG